MEIDKSHVVNIEKVIYNNTYQVDTAQILSEINILKLQLHKMGQNLSEIKQALADASLKADKVAADVQKLHDLIQNTGGGSGETPTPEEWQEVKDAAAALNAKLQSVDDATPEETPPPGE